MPPQPTFQGSRTSRVTNMGQRSEPSLGPIVLPRNHREGPDASSRLLLEALDHQLKSGDSLLDIGAGVGVLDFELLANGVKTSTLVDASNAYLEAAEREA